MSSGAQQPPRFHNMEAARKQVVELKYQRECIQAELAGMEKPSGNIDKINEYRKARKPLIRRMTQINAQYQQAKEWVHEMEQKRQDGKGEMGRNYWRRLIAAHLVTEFDDGEKRELVEFATKIVDELERIEKLEEKGS